MKFEIGDQFMSCRRDYSGNPVAYIFTCTDRAYTKLGNVIYMCKEEPFRVFYEEQVFPLETDLSIAIQGYTQVLDMLEI